MLAHVETSHRSPASVRHPESWDDAQDLGSLFRRQPAEPVPAGEALVWEGDPADHVFEVVEGAVRIFRMIGDGRRAIIGFVYPGELLGVSSAETYRFCAEAIVATKVRRLSRVRFQRQVVASDALRSQLIDQMCREMTLAHQQMVLLSRKTAEERVCSFLLAMMKKTKATIQGPVIDLPMSRLDIADHLGLTIETVSRTISRLTRMGVVRANCRHGLTVQALQRLAKMTGEDDDVEAWVDSGASTRRAVWPN